MLSMHATGPLAAFSGLLWPSYNCLCCEEGSANRFMSLPICSLGGNSLGDKGLSALAGPLLNAQTSKFYGELC